MLNSFLIIFENEFRKHGGDAICKREKSETDRFKDTFYTICSRCGHPVIVCE